MDESSDQISASGCRSSAKLLRYPLRSATKPKGEKPPLSDATNSASATKRVRAASSVSKSVSVLDLSGKNKSAKPPRRLSGSIASPAPKYLGNRTPVSDARSNKSAVSQSKNGTPLSDVSKSSSRKKFCVLSSASYWLTQIKLSESAAKHSISLGFFKLALEAGCEPIQRVTDELKSYVSRYNLSELTKELLESYKISSDNIEKSQVTETGSEVALEGNQLSDDDFRSSSSSVTDVEKLNLKSLEVGDEVDQVKKANSETNQKNDSAKSVRRSVTKIATSKQTRTEVKASITQKKPQKTIKKEATLNKEKVKQVKKSGTLEAGHIESQPHQALKEDKENLDMPEMEETSVVELQASNQG